MSVGKMEKRRFAWLLIQLSRKERFPEYLGQEVNGLDDSLCTGAPRRSRERHNRMILDLIGAKLYTKHRRRGAVEQL